MTEATDVVVDEVTTVAALSEVAALLAAVWERPVTSPPVPADLLCALAHAGSYVVSATADGQMVGAAVAFAGGDRSSLHSHVTGVLPAAQGRGVGLAIKHHQRAWAIERGFDRVTWTFDPLVRRNGRFNLRTLGAVAVAYHVDFYGAVDEPVNAGDETDRLLAVWDLAGQPERGTVAADPAPRLIQVPHDIVAIRQTDRASAHQWRVAVREAMEAAFDDGLVAVDVTDDGCYVFTPSAVGSAA